MGQIVSSAAKPKRANLNALSLVPTPAAGEYILVSSDNSMNAAGQGNFDCYIEGDGQKAATALGLRKIIPDHVEPNAGKNLFNANAEDYEEEKAIDYRGVLIDNANYDVSGYTRVKPNTEYLFSAANGQQIMSAGSGINFYDENRAFISTSRGYSVTASFTTPSNCYYVRMSLARSAKTYYPMLNEGAVRGGYEEYNPIGYYVEKNDNQNDVLVLETGIKAYTTAFTDNQTPALKGGGTTSSSAFKGYKIDLTDYASKYKYIFFRGSEYLTADVDSSIVRGIVLDANGNVESYVKNTQQMTNGWQSLPLTANSKTFWGTYCVNSSYGEVWSPSLVYFKDSPEILENAVESLLSDIKNVHDVLSYDAEVLTSLSGQSQYNIGAISGNSGTFHSIVGGLSIPKNSTFRFKLTGSGSVGRLLILANDSWQSRIQDYCALDTWYTIEAPYDITSLGYSTANDPSLTDVVFTLEYGGLAKNVEQTDEKVAELEAFSTDNKEIDRVMSGYYVRNNAYANTANASFDICQFVVGEGKKIRINARLSTQLPANGAAIRFQENTDYSTTHTYQVINNANGKDANGDYSMLVTMPSDLPVLCLTVDTGTMPTITYVEDTIGMMKEMYVRSEFSQNIVGHDMPKVTAENLSSDLTMPQFPYANKFGDKYEFSCLVDAFVGIKICRGFETYRSRWFEIDNTNITLKVWENALVPDSTVAVPHGLTIEKLLKVSIYVGNDGKAVVNILTYGGAFKTTFDSWGYDANGLLQVKNNGSTLSHCELSASNNYMRCPLWIFGASYEGVSNSRVAGQLKNLGFFNFFLNAYAGRNTKAATEDFKRALNFGRPKYLISTIMLNDGNNFQANFKALYDLCQALGVTLIGATHPSSNSDMSSNNAYLKSLGCRYVDVQYACKDPDKTYSQGNPEWYSTFLSSDNVHPTPLGAEAIAMQYLIDCPEIIQYAKDESYSTTPDYGGGDNVGG